MKKAVFIFLSCVAIVSFSFEFVYAQKCPPEGRKQGGMLSPEEKAFNKKKNKSSVVPKAKAEIISISALKSGKTKKDDKDYWYEGAYIEVNDAYLIDYKEQGGETCNCQEADNDVDDSKGDVHINIGNRKDLTDRNNDYYVVVEITPSYKKLHPDYKRELKELEGKKVTLRGYLFYDSEHERNSINYCSTCSEKGVWRKTCWEIHPVTFIGLND
jgi:hypothetical protein